MGLSRRYQAPNGVTLNYHRISQVHHLVNKWTRLCVNSYTSQAKRKEEESQDVYTSVAWFEMEYTDGLTMEQAYEWLKTQPPFDEAKDAIEGE